MKSPQNARNELKTKQSDTHLHDLMCNQMHALADAEDERSFACNNILSFICIARIPETAMMSLCFHLHLIISSLLCIVICVQCTHFSSKRNIINKTK